MKSFRPIEIVKCCICEEDIDKLNTREIFTGRVKYICPKCDALANKEAGAVQSRRRSTVPRKNEAEKQDHNKKI